jgi:hypothetical protein
VCQVLGLETRDVLESTFRDADATRGLFNVTVQPYQIWSGNHVWPHSGDLIAAFVDGRPRVIDILQLTAGADPRNVVFEWSLTDSDVGDCVGLCSPKPLTPRMSLSSPLVPVLCLRDAVHDKGFEARSLVVSHRIDGPMLYDSRNICAKRAYLQCILALPDIVAAGVATFPSDMPQAFYNLLLKSPLQATLGLSGADYKLMLSKVEGNHVYEVLDVPVPARAIADIQPSHEVAGDEGMEAVGDDMPLVALLDVFDGAAPIEEVVGGVPLDAAVGAPDAAEPVVIAGEDDGFDVPAFILGQRVRRETHYRNNGGVSCEGIRVQCLNPLHEHSRFRSMHMDTDIFGPRAAEFYLWAWLTEAAGMTCEEHTRYQPSRADIREIAETYG